MEKEFQYMNKLSKREMKYRSKIINENNLDKPGQKKLDEYIKSSKIYKTYYYFYTFYKKYELNINFTLGSINKARIAALKIGVNMRISKNEYKNWYDVLEEISNKWSVIYEKTIESTNI